MVIILELAAHGDLSSLLSGSVCRIGAESWEALSTSKKAITIIELPIARTRTNTHIFTVCISVYLYVHTLLAKAFKQGYRLNCP
jgi:hypothetical protein